jgi:hypothetical protein
MLSKTFFSAASAAILIMLFMVYYYIDESSLLLALLFALAVTNDYTMETTVVSMLGLVLLAIIGIYIGSAGSASSTDELSIPSGYLVGMSTTRLDCYEKRQEVNECKTFRFYLEMNGPSYHTVFFLFLSTSTASSSKGPIRR